MSPWVWAAIGAAWGAISGLLVAPALRRLPDSVPEIPYAHVPTHASIATRALPWLPLVGALAGALLGWGVHPPWPLLLWLAVLPAGLLLAVVDLHTRLLPRKVVVPVTLAAIAAVVVVGLTTGDTGPMTVALVCMLVVRSIHWLMWWIHAAGFGFGDVRLSALTGLLLGTVGVGAAIVGVYGAFLLHAVPGLAIAVAKRDRAFLKTSLPFGPAMLAGAVLGACWGQALWRSLAGG